MKGPTPTQERVTVTASPADVDRLERVLIRSSCFPFNSFPNATCHLIESMVSSCLSMWWSLSNMKLRSQT